MQYIRLVSVLIVVFGVSICGVKAEENNIPKDLCATEEIIRSCPKTCLPACSDNSVAQKFGYACFQVLSADLAGQGLEDTDQCTINVIESAEVAKCQEEFADIPELCDPDGFPDCTEDLPSLRKGYEGLVVTMGQSLQIYQPILDANIAATGSTEELCSYELPALVDMYRKAKIDNEKTTTLNSQISDFDACFGEVAEWFETVDLKGVKEEGSLRDDTVRGHRNEFAQLSVARQELTMKLGQVRDAAPALLSLARLHRRVCDDGTKETSANAQSQ